MNRYHIIEINVTHCGLDHVWTDNKFGSIIVLTKGFILKLQQKYFDIVISSNSRHTLVTRCFLYHIIFCYTVYSFLPELLSWVQFRKSKLEWDQLVSYVTLHTQSKTGHGNSQELVLSNVMTRYIYLSLCFLLSLLNSFPFLVVFKCYFVLYSHVFSLISMQYMLSSLKAAAEAANKRDWGSTGPTDAGQYNNWPEDTNFFRKEGGGWDSEYGEFFLTWYSQMLLDHGERILTSTKSVFDNTGVKISVKVAGIHWHYGTRSHAPELTAGYYNTRKRDGYLPIAQMLARHGAVFNFTCIEMRDHEQPQDALCAPEKLVNQVALATQKAQVHLAGENALPRYDEHAHEQILKASQLNVEGNSDDTEMCAFTYLRMNQHLFQPDNWRKFVAFVKKMKEGKSTDKCWEQVEREAEHFVHVTQPLVQEAVAMMH